ncbi:MarR family winged helix-turn-helix transcriptional regulator [Bacillus massiliglaciei]|uniref:MarR family winged helix-turn-helix transcriptional regulator n=1 Tax=Bacillus massiliglaciei TaxID=1816693 RepID=UPI000DA62AD6|nr:MarR family transcriptional regulator [Bacillus massiliglaciei]
MKQNQEFFTQHAMLLRHYTTKLNSCLAKYQLYAAQWSVLVLLFHEAPITSAEIAVRQSVEKPTITPILKKLHELGYIGVIAGKDKREKKLFLTDLGTATYKKAAEEISHLQKHALQGINEEEIQQVNRIIKIARNNLLK